MKEKVKKEKGKKEERGRVMSFRRRIKHVDMAKNKKRGSRIWGKGGGSERLFMIMPNACRERGGGRMAYHSYSYRLKRKGMFNEEGKEIYLAIQRKKEGKRKEVVCL